MRPFHPQSTWDQRVVRVSYGDRWQVQRRLQELSVKAWCSQDGHLRVEVNTHVEAAQVWSVARQFIASRLELVAWLEQCWQHNPPQGAR